MYKRQELERELSIIAKKGYAQDREEIEIGLRCVAAPIFNCKKEPVAAISISGMANKMTPDAISVIADDIVKCAKDISFKIGCRD